MRIGIIGAGTVGANLGKGWLAAGHDVMWSSRNPASPRMQQLAAETGGTVGTVADTAAGNDVLVMALPWSGIQEAVEGTDAWEGKVLIDVSNRFGPTVARSASEELAETTGARVAKCFNTIGAEHYLDPVFGEAAAAMFLCGADAEARDIAATLAADLGFEPVDIGGLEQAPILDAVARLWVDLVRAGAGRDIAITLVRKGR
jgi:predicted dinucleotide-binding enzyme